MNRRGGVTASSPRERFIDLWGSMGVLWGINRSIARVHAYILTAPAPVSLDELVESLGISKGNASMSLAELRNWGVIERSRKRGERRDSYVAEADNWNTLFRILKERKKREFDPAVQALRALLKEGSFQRSPVVAERLEELSRLLSLFDRVLVKLLTDEHRSRSVMSFVSLFLAE